jgi:peptidoglycan/LPS O-acetylase OafA/YrhL
MDINNKCNTVVKGDRDQTIDILRCIGLFAIFLAHVTPPDLVLRLRNFDVVLMVVCMTWSYVISRSKRHTPYFKYIIKRFKRLILPSWLYLTVLLVFTSSISMVLNEKFIYSVKEIIMGYSLLDRIGYVWVMRIYLYIAVLSPILYLISNKIKSHCLYFAILIIIYFVYNGIYLLGKNISNILIYRLFNITVLQFSGWGIVAAIGIRLFSLKENKKNYAIVTTIFAVVFILEMLLNGFASTQDFKYPPQLYYISYGIIVTLIIYILVKRIANKNNDNAVITFISKSSMELYFCQALLLEIINNYCSVSFKNNFVLYWVFLVISSMLITYVLKKSITAIRKTKKLL